MRDLRAELPGMSARGIGQALRDAGAMRIAEKTRNGSLWMLPGSPTRRDRKRQASQGPGSTVVGTYVRTYVRTRENEREEREVGRVDHAQGEGERA